MRGDAGLARPWPTVKTPTGKIVVSEQNYVVCERWEVCVGPIGRQENQEVDVFNVKSIDSWRTVAIRSFKPTYTKTNLPVVTHGFSVYSEQALFITVP